MNLLVNEIIEWKVKAWVVDDFPIAVAFSSLKFLFFLPQSSEIWEAFEKINEQNIEVIFMFTGNAKCVGVIY